MSRVAAALRSERLFEQTSFSRFRDRCRMTNLSVFDIDVAHSDGRLRMTVRGELDLATACAFEDQLSRLKAQRADVRLDLSRVEFMGCLGAHVLVNALAGAKRDGWRLEVEAVSPQIKRLFELTHLEHLLGAQSAN